MESIFDLVLLFAFVAAVSAGVAHALARPRHHPPQPQKDAVLRLRGVDGMYRARLLGIEAGGWALSAPLRRDAYVPIRVGEEFLVEAPTERGVILVRAIVVARATDPHRIVVVPRGDRRVVERRGARRYASDGERARIGPHSAELLDLSATGACLRVDHAYLPGDYVELEMPFRASKAKAYVVEAKTEGPGDRSIVRLAFDETVRL